MDSETFWGSVKTLRKKSFDKAVFTIRVQEKYIVKIHFLCCIFLITDARNVGHKTVSVWQSNSSYLINALTVAVKIGFPFGELRTILQHGCLSSQIFQKNLAPSRAQWNDRSFWILNSEILAQVQSVQLKNVLQIHMIFPAMVTEQVPNCSENLSLW